MPRNLGGAAAVVWDERIHVFGGRNSAGPLGTHFVFDVLRGEWTAGEDMVTLRDGAAAEAVNRRLYVVGGRAGLGPL